MPNEYFVDSSRNFREDGIFGPSRTTQELRDSNLTLHRWWKAEQERNKTLTTEKESLTRQLFKEQQDLIHLTQNAQKNVNDLTRQFNTERKKCDELLGRAKKWGLMLLNDKKEIERLKHQIRLQMIDRRQF
jgi:hypothetical protein